MTHSLVKALPSRKIKDANHIIHSCTPSHIFVEILDTKIFLHNGNIYNATYVSRNTQSRTYHATLVMVTYITLINTSLFINITGIT